MIVCSVILRNKANYFSVKLESYVYCERVPSNERMEAFYQSSYFQESENDVYPQRIPQLFSSLNCSSIPFINCQLPINENLLWVRVRCLFACVCLFVHSWMIISINAMSFLFVYFLEVCEWILCFLMSLCERERQGSDVPQPYRLEAESKDVSLVLIEIRDVCHQLLLLIFILPFQEIILIQKYV